MFYLLHPDKPWLFTASDRCRFSAIYKLFITTLTPCSRGNAGVAKTSGGVVSLPFCKRWNVFTLF